MDYRGHFGAILPQAQALNYAARLRGDTESMNLAIRQMEWVIGNNPFSQSTMYGEGYDFPPIYTPSSGDIVGGFPVGIQTRGDSDIPYWPVQNTWTYKEIWIHPVNQWIGLMRELVSLNGVFEKDVKTEKLLSLNVTGSTSAKGNVIITATVEGDGEHNFRIRMSNLSDNGSERRVTLQQGKKTVLKWQCKTIHSDEPWVAVVIADDDITKRWEITGSAWDN